MVLESILFLGIPGSTVNFAPSRPRPLIWMPSGNLSLFPWSKIAFNTYKYIHNQQFNKIKGAIMRWRSFLNTIFTLWSVLYQSPIRRVKSPAGSGKGTGILGLLRILIPPNPPAALWNWSDGKYKKLPIWSFTCIMYVKFFPGGMGHVVPYTPSSNEFFLCWSPFLHCKFCTRCYLHFGTAKCNYFMNLNLVLCHSFLQ